MLILQPISMSYKVDNRPILSEPTSFGLIIDEQCQSSQVAAPSWENHELGPPKQNCRTASERKRRKGARYTVKTTTQKKRHASWIRHSWRPFARIVGCA